MLTIGEIILFCATMTYPLLEATVSTTVLTMEFFKILSIIQLFIMLNSSQNCMESMPKNANYLSPEIQNEVLDVLAMSVIEQIRDSCTYAVFYPIGADETKDISKKELLTVMIRFIYSEEYKSVVERFVGLRELHGLDAERFTQTIVDEVEKELNLSLDNCLSVTFDGASTMSGSLSVVSKHN